MGIILISYVFQNSYADPPALRTLRIKVQLDKSVIARGDTQTVHFSVVDAKSRIPSGGSITRTTVTYPAGTPVRQFSTITDKSGHSSISWQIEDKAPLGSYAKRYDAFEQGYAEEGFGTNFAVVAHIFTITTITTTTPIILIIISYRTLKKNIIINVNNVIA